MAERKRRTPRADNVSLTIRIPAKMLTTMVGVSASTGLKVQDIAIQAIDRYLHERGAYEPYMQDTSRPALPSDVQSMVGVLGLPEVGDAD